MSAETETMILTKPLWEKFLDSLKVNDRKSQTIRAYRRCVEELYDFLPESKEITEDTLEDWKNCMKECGYSDNTINLRIAAANGLLKYYGMNEYTTTHKQIFRDEELPELTRTEYLKFLVIVRRLGSEQEYLIIKLLASVDIRIQELEYLTVEACREGAMDMSDGRRSIISPCMAKEMLDYAERRGIAKGPVFVTRNGKPLDRSNIAREIRNLAREAGMDPEKYCPKALHRVYLTTRDELIQRIMPIYLQTYDNLLNTEQAFVSWQ